MSTKGRFTRSFASVGAWLATLILVSVLGSANAGAGETSASGDGGAAAAETVARLHATLLDAMQQGESFGFDGRYQMISDMLLQTFDFETISRVVTGSAWKGFTDDERLAFMTAFARLSAATYADRFDEFKGETFTTLSVAPARNGMLVRTQIKKSSGDTVPIDYLVHDVDGQWRIINVVADGVSDLSVKRTEYRAVLRDSGLETLIESIDRKRAELEAG